MSGRSAPRRRGFLLLVLLLVIAGKASGAGFDCGKARTARERLVCADTDLSDADARMNGDYGDALRHLSAEGAAILRAGQQRWLGFAEEACAGLPAQAGTACLAQLYAERRRSLASAAVRVGPFLFQRVDDYRVTPAPAGREGTERRPARHELAYPRIDQPLSPVARLWNAAMARTHEKSWCDAGDGDSWKGYEVTFATARVISVIVETAQYCHGAAHPYGNRGARSLVIGPAPRPLRADDLFNPGAPWSRRLEAALLEKTEAAAVEAGRTLDDIARQSIAEVARSPERWILTRGGLMVAFNAQEVGPNAFQPRVTVPWTSLRGVLAAGLLGEDRSP